MIWPCRQELLCCVFPDGSDEGPQGVAFAAAGLKIGVFPLKLPDV